MSRFLKLSDVLLVPILSEWIDTETLATFDSAVCSHKLRNRFLTVLQNQAFVSRGSSLDDNTMCQGLRWVGVRGVKLRNLALSPKCFKNDLFQFSTSDFSAVENLVLHGAIDFDVVLNMSKLYLDKIKSLMWYNATSIGSLAEKCSGLVEVHITSPLTPAVSLAFLNTITNIIVHCKQVNILTYEVDQFYTVIYSIDSVTKEKSYILTPHIQLAHNTLRNLDKLFSKVTDLHKVTLNYFRATHAVLSAINMYSQNLHTFSLNVYNISPLSYSITPILAALSDFKSRYSSLQIFELIGCNDNDWNDEPGDRFQTRFLIPILKLTNCPALDTYTAMAIAQSDSFQQIHVGNGCDNIDVIELQHFVFNNHYNVIVTSD